MTDASFPPLSATRNTEARGFLRRFGLAAAAGLAAVLALIVLVDPYGTGRLLPGFAGKPVPLGANPAFSSAARLRSPALDAYVFGNSTLQTLSPERLNALTGRAFGQVTVPGSGPLEQAAMIRYAARLRGEGIRAAILGVDLTWCDPALALRGRNPFPLWLYAAGHAAYLDGVFRMNTLEAMPRRLAVRLGVAKPPPLDGYWNYELYVPPRPYPYATPRAPARPGPPHSAAETLRAALAAFPPATRVAVVLTPIYRAPGAPGDFATATGVAACKAEIVGAVAARPGAALVDRWRDTALNRDRGVFLDAIHFRAPVAQDIEAEAAAALR